MSIIQELPRSAVHTYLKLARLPLTAAELVFNTDADGDTSWPPALAFEDFEAKVKGFAGTVLSDAVLREDATLQRARVAQLRRAIELEAEAEVTRVRADQELTERRSEVAEEREAAKAREQAETARLERERREAEQRVEAQAAEKEREAAEVAKAERERVQRQERATEAKRLEAEREALAEKRTALATRDEAVRLEKAAQAAKQRRKR